MSYDYIIVGSGLFGAVFAYEATKAGKHCLVLDKRSHIGGNVYTKEVEGIQVHEYGAHIFHTSHEKIWKYMNQFAKFNRFTNTPLACYKDEMYNLPFNMNTFYKLWGVKTPKEAKEKINMQIREAGIKEPKNLEEQAIKLVGTDIYEKLIKEYTEKQWGRKAAELPPFIIKRLPVRFTYDNNYFHDPFQGIPIGGYTKIIDKMLEGIEVRTNTDFFLKKEEYKEISKKIVYTGMLDEYYQYCFGDLEYRSLRFETSVLEEDNFQGNAVVNYNEWKVPYTRIIEHKHFEFGTQPKTVITKEYPQDFRRGDEPYYPVNDEKNNDLAAQYKELAAKEEKVLFGGRLGQYQYYDMDQVVNCALTCVEKELYR